MYQRKPYSGYEVSVVIDAKAQTTSAVLWFVSQSEINAKQVSPHRLAMRTNIQVFIWLVVCRV